MTVGIVVKTQDKLQYLFEILFLLADLTVDNLSKNKKNTFISWVK